MEEYRNMGGDLQIFRVDMISFVDWLVLTPPGTHIYKHLPQNLALSMKNVYNLTLNATRLILTLIQNFRFSLIMSRANAQLSLFEQNLFP